MKVHWIDEWGSGRVYGNGERDLKYSFSCALEADNLETMEQKPSGKSYWLWVVVQQVKAWKSLLTFLQ